MLNASVPAGAGTLFHNSGAVPVKAFTVELILYTLLKVVTEDKGIGFEKRPSRCVGTTAKGKRCRNKGQGGWCHIHKANDALLEV